MIDSSVSKGDRKFGEGGRPSVSGGKHASDEHRVREYLMEWYRETPKEFTIDWSFIEIKVSGRLSRASGKFRKKSDETKAELKVASTLLQSDDEVRNWKKTARHEAVHAWQFQNHNRVSHGPTFAQWIDEFNIDKKAEKHAKKPKYEVSCIDCEKLVAHRHRECKLTKKTERYSCSECGGNLEVARLR